MLNLPVIITPLRTYLYGQTSFWMEVIYLQHRLIEYLEKYNFLKIADLNSIFADLKSIMQLSRRHFFADVKLFQLERLKTKLFWRKSNGLSENVSFNSEFALAFEIKPFKVAFFLFFFNVNFSKYSRAEWVNKGYLFWLQSIKRIVRQIPSPSFINVPSCPNMCNFFFLFFFSLSLRSQHFFSGERGIFFFNIKKVFWVVPLYVDKTLLFMNHTERFLIKILTCSLKNVKFI